MKTAALIRLARKGPIRARDLDEAAIPRTYLKRMTDQGVLEQVGRGLYRLVDGRATEHSTLVDVAKRVPHATICLLSALRFHHLTSEAPHAVWLLIDAHARAPSATAARLELVRASGVALHHGVETHIVEGVQVRVTTPAKTVADCFRFRRHVGLDVALAALKDYLRGGRSIDALVEAARADRIYTVMRPYLEALAS